jgi:uncharacterized membrane protein
MLWFVLGLVLFFGAHTVPIIPAARANAIQNLGATGYQAAFGIVSLAGLVLIAWGYSDLRGAEINPILYNPPTWTRHIALLLMIPAMIALAAAYVPSRIRTVLKHPMLVAIKIWALAHLLANGDLISVVLFGGFLAWAVVDRISVKKRGAMGPLGAKTGGLTGDLIAVAVGLGAYAFLLFYGHAWLFGVAPVPSLSA